MENEALMSMEKGMTVDAVQAFIIIFFIPGPRSNV